MTSAEGIAVGLWLAGLTGIVAIVIALIAYFGEIGRARNERARNRTRQREAYRRFVVASTEIISRGRDRIAECGSLARSASNGTDVGMPDYAERLRLTLPPLIDTISGLRLAAPFDADLAIALGEAGSVMRELLAKPLGGVPPTVLAMMLESAAGQLDEASQTILRRGHLVESHG
jgi:hypothetical protein